ncbi:hypothetical protein [Clostridium sp. AM58-1XD]|uniref:hypothetical protein n=1 Tax=Clostridium sp. AM58-1XD TaxID=2292307 RepID=UPI000E46EB7E|nr:hypothetical protein [Clostridium sp. AM58-1XD]RGZ01540.1 hypothetical protein DXA13_01505 [Clostridium sp. AM58-1XD]
MVEVKAPIGGDYVEYPAGTTIAFIPEFMGDIDGDNCTVQPYKPNEIAKAEIENYKDPGSGGYGENPVASLKLNKWLAAGDGNGSYKPLGGVKFQLKVKGYDYVLSELTTGLENDFTTEDQLTASAMTGYLRWEDEKNSFQTC